MNDPAKIYHIVLFSLYEFCEIFHKSFLMRQCAHKFMSVS
jgi:hypothetical protein